MSSEVTMSPLDEAWKLRNEYGLYKAYAIVDARCDQQQFSKELGCANHEELAREQEILRIISSEIAREAMWQNGWFREPGLLNEWKFSPAEWFIRENGEVYCPICLTSAPEQEIIGKPIMSKFCPDCGRRLRPYLSESDVDLGRYGITFRVDRSFVLDFFALKEGYETMAANLDILRQRLEHDLSVLYATDWISFSDVRFANENFIWSDKGFRHDTAE